MSQNDADDSIGGFSEPWLGYFPDILDYQVDEKLLGLLKLFGIVRKEHDFDDEVVSRMQAKENEHRLGVLLPKCLEFVTLQKDECHGKLSFGGLNPESGSFWNALRLLKSLGITGKDNAYLIAGVKGSESKMMKDTESTPGVFIHVVFCCLWAQDHEETDGITKADLIEYGRASYQGVKDHVKVENPVFKSFSGICADYMEWREKSMIVLNLCGLRLVANSAVQAKLRPQQNALLHAAISKAISGGNASSASQLVAEGDGYGLLAYLDSKFNNEEIVKACLKEQHKLLESLKLGTMGELSSFINRFLTIRTRIIKLREQINLLGVTVNEEPVNDWKGKLIEKMRTRMDDFSLSAAENEPDILRAIQVIEQKALASNEEYRAREILGLTLSKKKSPPEMKEDKTKQGGKDQLGGNDLLQGLTDRRHKSGETPKKRKSKGKGSGKLIDSPAAKSARKQKEG